MRPGAVLPTGARGDRPDYDYADGVTLTAYRLADGDRRTVTVPDTSGDAAAVFEVSRVGDRVHARRTDGVPARWNLSLAGVAEAAGATGGTLETTPAGVRVAANGDTEHIEIVLKS